MAIVDLDGAEIARMVTGACATLGHDWVKRRLQTNDRHRREAAAGNHRKRMIRHEAAHPFIQWLVEYQAWHERCAATNATSPNQSVILIATFSSNLLQARSLSGFDGVLTRLLKPSEFLSASFEIEVSTAYVNKGWSVEFVPAAGEPSPDLKVIDSVGQVFWVECKRRDGVTERDALNQAFFLNLKQALYRRWGPAKTNVGLRLCASTDPETGDLPSLTHRILTAAEQLLANRRPDAQVEASDEGGKYVFSLTYLADPDAELPFKGFLAQDGYAFEVSGEVRQTPTGVAQVRNPIWFAFKSGLPSDRFAGAINSFRAAVTQLPVEGPGVVWIRVPYPNGYPNAQSDLETLASVLRKELVAGQNTRVNAVVLSTRFFSSQPNQGKEAMTYAHACAAIEHPEPRRPHRAR
jgi:hypothetical protein